MIDQLQESPSGDRYTRVKREIDNWDIRPMPVDPRKDPPPTRREPPPTKRDKPPIRRDRPPRKDRRWR